MLYALFRAVASAPPMMPPLFFFFLLGATAFD